MKYQIGKTGRVAVARFDDGEDVLGGIVKLAKDEKIKAGVVYLVGGMKGGKFVVGPEEEDARPPKPTWREMTESHEVLAFGTIFWEGQEPRVHLHGAFGKRDEVRVGCLRKDSEAFLIIEAVIMEIEGVDAERVMDPSVGLPLLQL